MNQDVKTYYDNLWGEEGMRSSPPNPERVDRVVNRVLAAIRTNPGATIIDIGCGNGWILERLACEVGPSARLFGIEPSSVGARTTRLKVPQATIWEGTLETIDLPHQFDVAISSEVIEHVPDQPSFVAALSGVLKNDALLVLTTPNGRFRETFFRDFSDPQPVENWLNIHDIRILFTKWFSLEHYTTFDLSYYYNYVNSSLGALQRMVTRVRGGWRLWNAVVDAPLGRMGGFGLYQLIVLKRHCQ